jgi:hypothetical protein
MYARSYIWVMGKDSPTRKIPTAGCHDINDFKKVVKRYFSRELENVLLANITLHTVVESEPIRESLTISETHFTTLIYRTDYVPPHQQKKLKLNLTPERKERWDKLNQILKNIADYSELTFKDVENIYYSEVFVPYVQSTERPLKEGVVEEIHKILNISLNKLGYISQGNDRKRNLFIYPVLLMVANECPGVEIEIGEDLNGEYVNANAHFEFVLSRKANGVKKSVYIIEAKNDLMQNAMVRNLLGMEVVSDVYGLHTVYGIVTSFKLWYFLKSVDDKILKDEWSMNYDDMGGLTTIATKIYNMLME